MDQRGREHGTPGKARAVSYPIHLPVPRLNTLSLIVFALLTSCFLPLAARSNDDFGLSTVIRDVKKRFKLSVRDVECIRPILNIENTGVLKMYIRFSQPEPDYSDRVWRELIVNRSTFESALRPYLSKRQDSALRAARAELEKRILDYLVQDFVEFLGEILYLDALEFSEVRWILEKENKRKYQLIHNHLSDPTRLTAEMEKITRATRLEMETILSDEQLRTFRALTEPPEPIALLLPRASLVPKA